MAAIAHPFAATRRRSALLLSAVFVVAFNLRTTPASLPPLLTEIQPALHLSGAAAGLLFAGTVIAGIGVAAAGVALPGIVKDRFAHRPGGLIVVRGRGSSST